MPTEAQVAVARIFVHPGYDPRSQDNDIALVELAEEAGPLIAEIATARPAADPAQATVLGFGSFYEGRLAADRRSRTGAPAAQLSDRLRQAACGIVDPAGLRGAARHRRRGDRRPIRSAPAPGRDETCVGDSGGAAGRRGRRAAPTG